jgi:hypothetical protein
MVKREDEVIIGGHVRFVSYTGKYPCLCMGVLTLIIDNKEYKFGHDGKYHISKGYDDNNYDKFWTSGGECGFENDYANSYVHEGEWVINENELPNEFKKYIYEIDEVFNNNVEHGCCGGCL